MRRCVASALRPTTLDGTGLGHYFLFDRDIVAMGYLHELSSCLESVIDTPIIARFCIGVCETLITSRSTFEGIRYNMIRSIVSSKCYQICWLTQLLEPRLPDFLDSHARSYTCILLSPSFVCSLACSTTTLDKWHTHFTSH